MSISFVFNLLTLEVSKFDTTGKTLKLSPSESKINLVILISMHVRHSYRLSFPFFLKQSRMKFLSLLRDKNATPVTNACLACN
jgi:hypothetical protein